MPDHVLSCPECGFHVRLGAKLGLSKAVSEATAERKVAIGFSGRTGTKDERAAYERKFARKTMALVYGGAALALIAAVAVYLFYFRQASAGKPLDRLRADFAAEMGDHFPGEGQPIRHERAFSPFCIGMPFEIEVHPGDIAWEKPYSEIPPPIGDSSQWGTWLAQSWHLPYFQPNRRNAATFAYTNALFTRVFAALAAQTVSYSAGGRAVPGRLTPAELDREIRLREDGALPVWRTRRRRMPPARNLTGAVIDFGYIEDNENTERHFAGYARQDRPIILKGELSFAFSRSGDLRGPYGLALASRLDALPRGSPSAAGSGSSWFAHPVLVVSEWAPKP